MNIYMHQILEHQRVYDTTAQRTYTDVSVIHVYQDQDTGTYWGCTHEPKRQLLKRDIPRTRTQSELVIVDKQRITLHNHVIVTEKTYIPVHLEGQGWMSVHRDSEEVSWIKTDGTDAGYRDALHDLGFGDREFKFDKANRVREPHVNEIPIKPTLSDKYTLFIAKPTRTPYTVICELADGWDKQQRPWFATSAMRQAALDRLHREFPPKKRKGKSVCSAPVLMGTSMGQCEDDDTPRMGYYLMEAK